MRLALLILSASALFGQGLPFGSIPQAVGGGSCASGYLHCRLLTIDHTQVGGSTLSTFGVLVSTTLGSSRIQNANCYDVIFSTDQAGASKVPFEMESCNQSTGAIVAWVGLASISASANTLFYVSYDNSSISTAQNTGSYAPSNVWDSNYIGVWHLATVSSAVALTDSTSNGLTWAVSGTTISAGTGQIDGSFGTNPGGNAYTHAHVSAFDSSDWTAEAWLYSTNNNTCFIMSNEPGGSAGHWILTTDGSGHLQTSIPYIAYAATGATVISLNTWHHVVGTKVGTLYTVYLDGVSDGTATVSNTPTTGSELATITQPATSTRTSGQLDELRLSGVGRPTNWITAEYNNQKSSSTFLSVGSEI